MNFRQTKRLLIVAPEAFQKSILEVFDVLYTGVEFIPLVKSSEALNDPFGIEEKIKCASSAPDAVLLIAPANRSPARLVPHSLLNGVPVGIVQPDSYLSLQCWLKTVSGNVNSMNSIQWAILSMSKKEYLTGAEKMLQGLRASARFEGIKVERWFADTMYREDLCRNLAKGPNLAIYFGHARPRGWSGYRAVRWPHIIAEELIRPVDVLISIACSTLKKQHQRPSFGTKWINQGRACTFVGNVSSVKTEDNDALSHLILEIFLNEEIVNIGQLWRFIESRMVKSPMASNIKRALKTYRILGNPLQPIKSPKSIMAS